jgi:hypothetical protein
MTQTIEQIIARWDSGDGKPYKGLLIDWDAFKADPENMGCMCAQGQVLALAGGWDYAELRDTEQWEADIATAKLLNISRAHAVLLRNINDKADGAPSIVLTDPGKVLGDQWSKLLDFWWLFDGYIKADWRAVAKAWAAAGDAARAAAWAAARYAAWYAAGDAAGDAAGAAARYAARYAAWYAAGDAARAAAREIQGYDLLIDRGHKPFFLPMFGFAAPADIPARPADYGNGIVPKGDKA